MQQNSTKKQEDTYYTIESILQQKSIQNQIFYLIKWQDYPIEQSTWEPAYKIAETSELFGEYIRHVKKSGPNFYQSQYKDYVPPPIEEFNIIKKKTKLELISDLVEGINNIKDSTQQIAQYSKILKDHYNPTELHNTQENCAQTESQMKSGKQNKQPQQAVIDSKSPSKVVVVQPESIKENIVNEKAQQQKKNPIQQQQTTQKKNQQDIIVSVKEEEEPICQIPISDFNKCGSFENGDQIQRIGKSVIVKETGQKRYFVLWKKRAEGYYPKSSWVTSQELLEKDPQAICRYIKGVMRL